MSARHNIGWRRHLANAFTQNLPLKASALLLAIVLWFVVAAREPTEEVVSVRFEPQLDTALVLRDPKPVVRALVIGRATEILKLSNTPLVIRRPIASDVPDTAVLSLRPGDIEVPNGVEVLVRDVQPREVMLRFEATSSRLVPVRSAIVVAGPPEALPVGVRLDPESVTVRGPRRNVALVRFVSTVPDTIALDTLPHLVDIDTSGMAVSVRPTQVKAILGRIRP